MLQERYHDILKTKLLRQKHIDKRPVHVYTTCTSANIEIAGGLILTLPQHENLIVMDYSFSCCIIVSRLECQDINRHIKQIDN